MVNTCLIFLKKEKYNTCSRMLYEHLLVELQTTMHLKRYKVPKVLQPGEQCAVIVEIRFCEWKDTMDCIVKCTKYTFNNG